MPYDKTADLAKYHATCAEALRIYKIACLAGAQSHKLKLTAIIKIKGQLAKFNAMPLHDREHPANIIRKIELESQLERLTRD